MASTMTQTTSATTNARGVGQRRRARWQRRLGLTLLALPLALAATATRADAARPSTTGAAEQSASASLPYSTRDFDWLDAARSRAVPVRLYLPDAAAPHKPVPLVVFSHGIGGSRSGYSYLGRHWASQGYASLHLQHVGSDRSVWFGSPFGLLGRLQSAAQDNEAVARVQDLSFALDQLLKSDLAPRLDSQRIVAAGHSYGANTALLASGAVVQRNGQRMELRDARIKATIVLSAPPFYGEAAPERILGAISVPSLHVTATEDIIRIPGYYSGADDRVAVFDATGSQRKTLAVFEGGSHSMFTDRAGTGGALLNPQVKEATRELSVAFLNSVFKGDEAALASWPKQFAAIVARYTSSPH
jgi:predicted dienelactone hydrolase